jgi:hypothetical protein
LRIPLAAQLAAGALALVNCQRPSLDQCQVSSIRTRKDRETFERLLGIVLYHDKLLGESISNFGNIVGYPGSFESQISTPEQGAHAISQKGYSTAIIKVWRGR